MKRIKAIYLLTIVLLSSAAFAATPVREKYSNARLGYEVVLPAGVVCMVTEPGQGCGFNIAMRFTESLWQTDALPARYMWVSGEFNTGAANTLERAVQRAIDVSTTGHAGALVLGRKSVMASGLPGAEIEISYNSEDGEVLEKIAVFYRERRGAPNVIYTFGLHTPRRQERDDLRLFRAFVAGFRVR